MGRTPRPKSGKTELWTLPNPGSSTQIELQTHPNPPKIPNFEPTNWVRPNTNSGPILGFGKKDSSNEGENNKTVLKDVVMSYDDDDGKADDRLPITKAIIKMNLHAV